MFFNVLFNGAPTLEQLLLLVVEFVTSLGLGGLVSAFVQLLKRFGLPDGMGGTAAVVVNVVVFVLLVVGNVFFGVDVESDTARQVFQALSTIAGLLLAIFGSVKTFEVARGANVMGFRKRE